MNDSLNWLNDSEMFMIQSTAEDVRSELVSALSRSGFLSGWSARESWAPGPWVFCMANGGQRVNSRSWDLRKRLDVTLWLWLT